MKIVSKLSILTIVFTVLLSTCSFAKTVISRGAGGEPATLDPHKITGTWENDIVSDLFIGLFQDGLDGSLLPAMAKDWNISKDGTIYTIKLRDDVIWSDGTPITSEDFVYSYQRILSPKMAAIYANLLYPIKNAKALNMGELKNINDLGVKAVDKYTLQITLESPTPYFLELLKHFVSHPIPRHVVEKYGKDWAKPEHIVSNGAFVLDEWKAQTYVKLVKNEKFFDAKSVKVDEVYFIPMENQSSALKRFRAGEIDMYADFPTEQFKWLKKNMPNETIIAPYIGIYYYAINLKEKKFQDKRVREALNLALNREILVDKVLTTGEIAAYSFSPKMTGYEVAELNFKSMPTKQRLQRAKKLLEDAGYSKENPLTVKISYNTSENHKKVAIAIASMWKQVGIKAELSNAEVAVHYANLRNGEFEIARGGYIANYIDAENFLSLFEYPNSEKYGSWKNDEYNKLMAQAAHTIDLKKRAKIMKSAERIMLDDFAVIPIYYYVSRNLVSKDVKGWEPNIRDIHRTRWMSK